MDFSVYLPIDIQLIQKETTKIILNKKFNNLKLSLKDIILEWENQELKKEEVIDLLEDLIIYLNHFEETLKYI